MGTKMARATCFLLIITLISSLLLLVGCTESPNDYTVEQHSERISKRIEERYFKEETNLTGYTLYPLYNADEELTYFLIEFEPYGFAFVSLRKTNHWFGMYFISDAYMNAAWQRYRLCIDGKEPQPYEGKQWLPNANNASGLENFRYEIDNDNNFIEYNHSPYKIADVLNQKLYLLDINIGHIPAIKQGDKFFSLISMDEIDYLGYDYYKSSKITYDKCELAFLNFTFFIKDTL